MNCLNCKQKNHTSICDKVVGEQKAMTASTEGEKVCHPVVVVNANGTKCRALLDTGATGSYASAYFLDLLKLKPKTTLNRRIQTIMGIETKNIHVYDIKVSNLKGDCKIPVCVTRIERSELLSLDNPDYPEMIKKYNHLCGVRMDDVDKKSKLPVHLILGTNEYTKIKTSEAQRAVWTINQIWMDNNVDRKRSKHRKYVLDSDHHQRLRKPLQNGCSRIGRQSLW
jgi:hypothetical protein